MASETEFLPCASCQSPQRPRTLQPSRQPSLHLQAQQQPEHAHIVSIVNRNKDHMPTFLAAGLRLDSGFAFGAAGSFLEAGFFAGAFFLGFSSGSSSASLPEPLTSSTSLLKSSPDSSSSFTAFFLGAARFLGAGFSLGAGAFLAGAFFLVSASEAPASSPSASAAAAFLPRGLAGAFFLGFSSSASSSTSASGSAAFCDNVLV